MAESLLSDYIEDLAEYRVSDLDDAVKIYRRDSKNRFYPTPGQLIEIIERQAVTKNSAFNSPEELENQRKFKEKYHGVGN